ncbi:MAG: hypothetical protein ABH828_00415 [archaeon]
MKYREHPENSFGHWVSTPIIYFQAIPLVLLDISMELYHRICFPLYGLPLVERSKYIKIDRHKLKYLTPMQKLGCVYCGYANGLLPYATKIAAETEKYWCGIQHQKSKDFKPPEHHKKFFRFGDEKAFWKFRNN